MLLSIATLIIYQVSTTIQKSLQFFIRHEVRHFIIIFSFSIFCFPLWVTLSWSVRFRSDRGVAGSFCGWHWDAWEGRGLNLPLGLTGWCDTNTNSPVLILICHFTILSTEFLFAIDRDCVFCVNTPDYQLFKTDTGVSRFFWHVFLRAAHKSVLPVRTNHYSY